MNLSPGLLQVLFEQLSDLALAVTPDGLILAANSAAATLLGRSAESLIGGQLDGWLPEDQGETFRKLLRGPDPVRPLQGFALRTADGVRVPVEAHVLQSAGAGPDGPRLLLAHDLRPRQALERELAEIRIQLSEDKQHLVLAALAGAAAHELNQPLTAVMGYAELLRRKVEDGTPMAEPLDVILAQAERMAELVRKIGRVSKFETKSYLLGARIVDLDRAGDE